jgi:hypothetical protein
MAARKPRNNASSRHVRSSGMDQASGIARRDGGAQVCPPCDSPRAERALAPVSLTLGLDVLEHAFFHLSGLQGLVELVLRGARCLDISIRGKLIG